MSIFESILLGILQGLTEFLPVSSSGHLVILQRLLKLEQSGIVFEIAVHLGTVLSIVTIYSVFLKHMSFDLIKGLRRRELNSSLRLMLLIIVGSIPTAFIGLLFKEQFESMFSSTLAVGISFCITGAILFLTKNKGENLGNNLVRIDTKIAEDISFKQAFLMGLIQGFSITPGISRSGSTIAVGLLAGVNRGAAAAFSFLMSVPAILGAALLQFMEINEFSSDLIVVLIVGLTSAYLSGLFGLWLVLKVVSKGRLDIFGYYLWLLGPLVIFLL